MKTFPWLLIGIGVGAAIVYVLSSEPQYATGSETIEGAARKASGWGTKQRVAGKVQSVAGAVKEGIGTLSGKPNLQDEGSADRLAGVARDAAGKLGEAVGQTIHDLNV